MDKKKITAILEEIALLLEMKGENPFKSRAYSNGARIIENIDGDLAALIANGELEKTKGIGQALYEKIKTLMETGSLPYYDELKNSVPAGLMEMIRIPGLGAKKVKTIHEKLDITSVLELEYACKENRLRDLPGFGQKSQDKILQGIELHKKYSERYLYHIAESEAYALLEYMKKADGIIRIELAGSLRRHKETIKDVDILASCADEKRESIMQYFTNYPERDTITGQGNTKSSIVLNSGINSDLRLVTDTEFPFALHHFTGSKEHNTAMRSRAKAMDLKMSEYGLFRGEEVLPCKDENEIFTRMGLQYIPPELRENMGEIEAAAGNELPELYDGNPFHGIFHVHTTYSDGAHSVKEMADACRAMDMQYIGISDHSKAAFYANGLTEERVIKQHAEIDELNRHYDDFTIFKGIEVDILPDGSLDYSDEVLATFDFVIASVHSSFQLPQEEMTKRILRALQNPYVTMLGHPTGRLLLGREPYALDMEEIIREAGRLGKIVEINSSPHRFDMDWRLGRLAAQHNVRTSLNPDSHSIDGLPEYRYGIGIARKAWFTKERVLNSFTTDEVRAYFQSQR
jgi:DNA polymerase (family 10)